MFSPDLEKGSTSCFNCNCHLYSPEADSRWGCILSGLYNYTLSVAKERKLNTYSTACHSMGVSFIHLAVETLRGWDEEAVNVIKSIGRLLGQRLGISPAETMQHLFQRLVLCLCRGPLVDGHS